MDLRIGTIALRGRTMLAPMAGVTDLAFRTICAENGASYLVTEMVSAKALCYNNEKTKALLALGAKSVPCAAQIFGSEAESMARGARLALEYSQADAVDINMGCPAPKIVSNGDGSALMREPERAARVIRAVVDAVHSPVTVKFRLGWDEAHVNCVEFARMAEASGAQAICLHARTKTQMYAGKADYAMIAAVKRAVNIPVIGNGDVASPDDALRMRDETGVDFIMIGRGALGNPWIFSRVEQALAGRTPDPTPPLGARMETARRQIMLAAEYKGERTALLEARKHMAWYLKGVAGAKPLRERVSALTRLEDLQRLIEDILDTCAAHDE